MAAPAVADGFPEGPPKYWKYESNYHELAQAIRRYLSAEPLTVADIALIANYLRRWIEAPFWHRLLRGSRGREDWARRLPLGLSELRVSVRGIHSRRDIEEWRAAAAALGIDPF